ncbi:MAG: zinc ribbon domain-containing protein [marine benthic group bacterium]|jgi:putative FmdB family regulatory protein|nr:zinc ribbon domain-containing protein [Gemmatimonadota bacterium]MCL7963134.1 zinc ribbon domain-containing protein [Candidatus Carthagonibacter metallireducens]MCL7957010.1 zinc ribbon domain-containing protein [Gemmatimonadota bacterium]MCL7963871.1 zinc ribbon domain-containing protein [Gemmatimonadota bacterium]MCL7968522.1 zinc ribbon domain-containing protein [Gemmatimonadota bacterium]
MPTYEYECDSCGISFERLQRISDDPIRECPECGGEVRRLISSGGGLVFKGPGFYATDYGGGGASGSGGRSNGQNRSGEDGGSKRESSATGSGDSSGGGDDDS